MLSLLFFLCLQYPSRYQVAAGRGPSFKMGRLIYIILLGYRHLAYSYRFSSTKGSLSCAAKMHTGLPRFIRSIRKTCNQLWSSEDLPFSSVLQSFGCECAMSGDCLSDYSMGGNWGVVCVVWRGNALSIPVNLFDFASSYLYLK